jgi:thiamine-phosphate pyrophosphorylase
MGAPELHGLYAITLQLESTDELLQQVEQAILGGARIIQYRNKSADEDLRHTQASDLLTLCQNHHVPLIINDDVMLARAVGADGVHLGGDDMHPPQARKILGKQALIGVSCYNHLARAIQAETEGADYIAFGSFFASQTKPKAVRAELSLLTQAKQQLSIPIVAIGGITAENGARLIQAGVDMLAVIQGVFGQPEIQVAAHEYAALFEKHKNIDRITHSEIRQ